jgi:hypothetical protein
MRWIWLAWLLVAVVGGFSVLEYYAYTHDTTTLSRFVWEISERFPPFPFLIGFIVGFLSCHFWWGGIVSFEKVKHD